MLDRRRCSVTVVRCRRHFRASSCMLSPARYSVRSCSISFGVSRRCTCRFRTCLDRSRRPSKVGSGSASRLKREVWFELPPLRATIAALLNPCSAKAVWTTQVCSVAALTERARESRTASVSGSSGRDRREATRWLRGCGLIRTTDVTCTQISPAGTRNARRLARWRLGRWYSERQEH
jgi:hypothetical protein